MSRVEAASGAKYTAQKEAPRRFEPIAPVGTNYVPVGRPDIDALRRNTSVAPPAPPAASRPVPSAAASAASRAPPPPSAPRPAFGSATSTSGFGRAPAASAGRVSAPDDDWDTPAPSVAKPPPPPAAFRPPVVAASRPVLSVCIYLAMMLQGSC